jgi:ABC-type transporter Mla subunit MlaD
MTAALTRPNLIARAVALAAVAGIVLVLVLLLGGGSPFMLKLEMANADGIRPGSQVLLGGVSRQIAKLDIDPKRVRIGHGTTEKYAALHPANPQRPLPSGSTLPMSAVTIPTDLDQIIDVMDPDTRRAMATLINEAGLAVAGRRRDVASIIRQLPVSVERATKLLQELVHDNHTLEELVAAGNRLIARINLQRTDLQRVIDAASGAGDLQKTVIEAPGSL